MRHLIAALAAAVLFVSGCDEKKQPAAVSKSVSAPQKLLRWKSKDGTLNYTDDAASIPAGVVPEETEGAEIKVIAAPKPQVVVASATGGGAKVGSESQWRERFGVSRRRIFELEQLIAADAKIVGPAETNELLQEALGDDPTFHISFMRLKENRAELTRQGNALKELHEAADAVSVPGAWRE